MDESIIKLAVGVAEVGALWAALSRCGVDKDLEGTASVPEAVNCRAAQPNKHWN